MQGEWERVYADPVRLTWWALLGMAGVALLVVGAALVAGSGTVAGWVVWAVLVCVDAGLWYRAAQRGVWVGEAGVRRVALLSRVVPWEQASGTRWHAVSGSFHRRAREGSRSWGLTNGLWLTTADGGEVYTGIRDSPRGGRGSWPQAPMRAAADRLNQEIARARAQGPAR